MLTDRIGARAESSDFVVFGGAAGGESGSGVVAPPWAEVRAGHLARAAELARSLRQGG
ncbi:hypothetical protein J7E93_05480 [Streptomyces sp. ISL-36]|uniref:hypothetical protein n=1 Tax=Streptomyces sp. ISL-36 TaxID=2819182 RepID=UPI001BE596DD|nr:hypothetical protein [Streptomyces sp. ISL-36]MBT2439581.1 hypothetical protein [Streptomyces sp. ISL-36]